MSKQAISSLPQPESASSKLAFSRKCLCHYVTNNEDDNRLPWDYSLLCSACCKCALRPHWKRHEEALIEREVARERCAQKLTSLRRRCQGLSNDSNKDFSGDTSNLSELQFESQRLRDRLAKLQQQGSSLAVEVTSLAVENEEKRANLSPIAEMHRQQLQRLDQSVCEGSMKQAIEAAREQVRILRFQWALKAFAMHRLDVRAEDIGNGDEDPINDPLAVGEQSPQATIRPRSLHNEGRQKQARGIGKIGGLPLPHAGPELYGVLPIQELQSALRLVASVTSTVARCLGIKLPHPALLHPTHSFNQGDIIHSAILKQSSFTNGSQQDGENQESDPASTESLMSLLESSLDDSSDARSSQAKSSASGGGRGQGLEERANATVVPLSMDPSLVSRRLHHATAAVIAEAGTKSSASSSAKTSSQYALAADMMHEDEFAIALQLLQNNVIALCIRAGVPVDKLFPAEAVLLNLYILQVFCEDQIRKYLD